MTETDLEPKKNSHQKHIVDDILTLSKLDSHLLLVTPVDVRPVRVIQNVLRMFETELNTNDIRGEFRIMKSYRDLGIDWVKLDPSRLSQVLINLLTNAIKFTQSREKRSIVINLGASMGVDGPPTGRPYFPSIKEDRLYLTDNADWGTGQKVNLLVSVEDTGPGLDEHEERMLFQRFSQTSPRTHVQYGGSGLGLFISRTLTELQGGQIGVTSIKGVGSTFEFYVQSRIARRPPQTTPTIEPPPLPANAAVGVAGPEALVAYSTSGSKPPTPAASLEQASPRFSQSPVASRHEAWMPLDVLIVEDNLVNQKVLQRQLINVGSKTYLANHGGEALEALQKSRFWSCKGQAIVEQSGGSKDGEVGASPREIINISIILMDLEMPIMDGMTCTRRIRELERDGTIVSHIPIIAVTAYARPEQIENAKAAGVVSIPPSAASPRKPVADQRTPLVGRCHFEAISNPRTHTQDRRTRFPIQDESVSTPRSRVG